MQSTVESSSPNRVFNVRQYGACGDGIMLDTNAIQTTINICHAHGGGRVELIGGTFLSGTLRMCSNVELHVAKGATLFGTPDKDFYSGPQDTSGSRDAAPRWLHAMIIGEGVEHISFTGEGVLDGNNVFDPEGEENMRGPHLILLRHCRNVTLRDLTIRHAANYAFFFYATQRVNVENATFEGGWDGIHFRDLNGVWNSDVRIVKSRFFTGDDAIAGACVKNALIEECLINSSCNGLRIIGPAQRFTLAKCRFEGPGVYPHRVQNRFNMLVALNVQPGAWGPWPGPLDDLRFQDIEMENVQSAFHIVLREGNSGRRILLERIRATLSGSNEAASSIESWNDEPLHEIICRDISILASGGGGEASKQLPVELPQVGARPLPVWGFFARNVVTMNLERVELATRESDARPAIRLNGVTRVHCEEVHFRTPQVPTHVPSLHAKSK